MSCFSDIFTVSRGGLDSKSLFTAIVQHSLYGGNGIPGYELGDFVGAACPPLIMYV